MKTYSQNDQEKKERRQIVDNLNEKVDITKDPTDINKGYFLELQRVIHPRRTFKCNTQIFHFKIIKFKLQRN